jgi:hypothetical protein
MKTVFSDGTDPLPYNNDPRPAEIKLSNSLEKQSNMTNKKWQKRN